MTKLVLSEITNILGNPVSAANTINDNSDAIINAIENTLSRNGQSPNTMNDNLDMNSNQILNLPTAVNPTDPVRLQDLEGIVEELVSDFTQGPTGPEGPTGPTGPTGPVGPGYNPRGDYSGSEDYLKGDAVVQASSSWVARIDTTGNAPPTLPTTTNTWWMLAAAQGPQGASGAGTGDVLGPVASIDNELPLFSGTGGKTLKRSSATGIPKLTSGVVGTASAGTDYYAPGSTDVAIADGGTGASTAANAFAALKQAATDSATGVVELATIAETSTGTDTGRAVTPDGLAGSIFGTAVITIMAFDGGQDVVTGDAAGGAFYRIPSTLNGMNLVGVAAQVFQAGTTGTVLVQLNSSRLGDMLSTRIMIDSGETDSSTSATPAIINTSSDDVITGDRIRIDVDSTPTVKPLGLVVELTFRLP